MMKKLQLITLLILCFAFPASAAKFFNLGVYHSGGLNLHDDDTDDDGNDTLLQKVLYFSDSGITIG